MTRVGIIGAGIAGLACAQRLADCGIDVTLLDKGNRPGGRLASVVIDDMAWDIGAQSFSARHPDFAVRTALWLDAGWAAPWPEGPDGAYVGVPSMAALVGYQCADLDARFGCSVQRIEREAIGWFMAGSDFREGPFTHLVIAVPAEQAATLLSLHDIEWAREAAVVRSTPCWSVMTSFSGPIASQKGELRYDGALATAVRTSSKPGRGAAECWTLQASITWSRDNLERPRDEVASQMLETFAEELGMPLPTPVFAKAHRWRFALPFGQPASSLYDDKQRLGTCGDWCVGPTIEEAWLSGNRLAAQIAASVGARRSGRCGGRSASRSGPDRKAGSSD